MHGRTWHAALAALAALVACLVSAPRPLLAQRGDDLEFGSSSDPDDEADGEPGGAGPEHLTDPGQTSYAFAVATAEDLGPAANELATALRDLLEGSPQFSTTLAEARMNGLDAAAAEVLDQARELFETGRTAYDNLEMEEAVERFEQALRALEEQVGHLPDIGPLTDALLYMGAAQVLAGDERAARNTFARLLTVDPESRPSPDTFPPPVVETFRSSAARMARVRTGSVEVTAEPAAAQVFVDGVYRGPAPQLVDDLKEGSHYVRVTMAGHVAEGRVVQVRARRRTPVALSLEMTEDGPAVAELLALLPGQLEERPGDAVATVQRLGEILGVEVLVTAVVERAPEGVAVRLLVWDVLRGETLAAESAGPFDTADGVELAGAAAASVDQLLAAAVAAQRVEGRPAPLLPPRRDPPPPPAPDRPFWRQWWFWTVIGVAVVGAGLGIGFGAAAASGGPERTDGQVILDL